MSIKRTLALALAMTLAVGAMAPALRAAQDNGVLGGKATDEAKKRGDTPNPYADYSVRLRNPDNTAILKTVPLDAQGQFSFTGLSLSQVYLVELFNMRENKLVCTEGQFRFNANMTSKTDVNIDCGGNPTAWIIVAGAGAAILAGATLSNGQ